MVTPNATPLAPTLGNIPDLDIWMPVYNASATLPAALKGLCQGSHKKFRLLAVDDGSTDDSLALLKQWAQKDPRLEVVASTHKGLVSALETCAELSTAPIVARADADDIYHPRRLEEQLALLTRLDHPGLVGTAVAQFPQNLRGPGMKSYVTWVNSLYTPQLLLRDRLIECPLVHTTFMFTRHSYDLAGGYQEHHGPEDLDLLLRMVAGGTDLACVPKVRCFWRLAEASLQKTDPRYQSEGFLDVKLNHLHQLNLWQDRPVVLWGQTRAGKHVAKNLKAHQVKAAYFLDLDPKKIGQKPHGLEVLDERVYTPNKAHFYLGLVRNAEARRLMRQKLTGAGLVEWRDFVLMQ